MILKQALEILSIIWTRAMATIDSGKNSVCQCKSYGMWMFALYTPVNILFKHYFPIISIVVSICDALLSPEA